MNHVLSQQGRRTFGIAVTLFCLLPNLVRGQFFEEPKVWKGTDSIGRKVVLYLSPENHFYSQYPLLTSATGDGHGIWSIDSTDSTIRFRSLSSADAAFPLDLISRRYTLAKGQERAIVLTAGDTKHQLTLKPSDDSPAFLPEELIEYSIQVPKNVFYDPSDPSGHGLNLDSWTPHGMVFTDSTGAEISLGGADKKLFRLQRNEAAGHTLVYLAQPLQAKPDQSSYELSIVRQPGLAKRPIVAASTERFLIHVNPSDSVVSGLPPIFALPPIFLGPESDSPLKIQFFGPNNYTLSVEDSGDLLNWKTVGRVDGEGEFIEWIDSRSDRPQALFYRIRLTPKALASPGVFDFSGGKPVEPGGELAQGLAKVVLARLNIKGRSVTGATVKSVVQFLPPIFAPGYLVELEGLNEQQQPVAVYAKVSGNAADQSHVVTRINVDDQWELPLHTDQVEVNDLSLQPSVPGADKSANLAVLAVADLNERTGKEWGLDEVISSNVETEEETDHLVLSITTAEGEEATVFAEVSVDSKSNVLTAFTQSELGVTVVPLGSSDQLEAGDAVNSFTMPERVGLGLVKPDSPLAKRLAEFVLGQEPAVKDGLKLKRIIAVTQAKATSFTSYFLELLATTEKGETALVQAHVRELDDGKFGLVSFQMDEDE